MFRWLKEKGTPLEFLVVVFYTVAAIYEPKQAIENVVEGGLTGLFLGFLFFPFILIVKTALAMK